MNDTSMVTKERRHDAIRLRLDGLAEGEVDFLLERAPGDQDPDTTLHLTLFLAGRDASLSAVLPVLHSLGFEVLDEYPSRVVRGDGAVCWTYDFRVRLTLPAGVARDFAALAEDVTATLRAIWLGALDADQFNGLVVRAGLTWRQADLLRAYGRYLRQLTFPFSQSYICSVLLAHPEISRGLVELFHALLDPDPADGVRPEVDGLRDDLVAGIDAVASIDADRILRAYLAMVEATVRTNYFRRSSAEEALALKLVPGSVEEIPQPRPSLETYVHSRRVEGVHLRFGRVARGGIRFSDRQQDFRTEVLGLAKAQTTKNAVIVPLGAKGGFIVKQLPAATGDPARDRARHHREVVDCYRMFIHALLDVVDNLDVSSGQVITDPLVARRDGDDTYLVVAADKGTASFSDHANEVALRRGYWLGDAFASGGSVGYDHKAMGITARGAWESVRQHLGELGRDVDADLTTVVGVGDMSGDVFGNGMLLSRRLALVAAFDHRHIFLDPDPDPERSYAERERLFGLPRSSWQDYEASLISPGGGVWPRTRKSIPISPQVRARLGVHAASLTPQELISVILRAPVDLLWNGGIGTYVKSSAESHSSVGDKANDALRINADELRARVVGEGGNLGLTQRARIEFARAGGRINTDALDNSAGVDCSDHEVNIKIVIDAAIRSGSLPAADRTALLESMTGDVAELVLTDNRDQNEILGLSRVTAGRQLPLHARLLEGLEESGQLDRTRDVLPAPSAIRLMASTGQGLSSPELATVIALVKLSLKHEVLASNLPDVGHLGSLLADYFPAALAERFGPEILAHPLRREIIATTLANDIVNTGGLTYVLRLQEQNGASVSDVIRAHIVASEIFRIRQLRAELRELDPRLGTMAITEIGLEITRLLDRATRWVLVNRPQPAAIGSEVLRYRGAVTELAPSVSDRLAGHDAETADGRIEHLSRLGVPAHLARRLGALVYEFSLLNVVDAAEMAGSPDLDTVAEVYYTLSAQLRVGKILTELSAAAPTDRWDSRARLLLRDDLRSAMCVLVAHVLQGTPRDRAPRERVAEWQAAAGPRLQRVLTVLDQADAEFGTEKATSVLSVLARQIHGLAAGPSAIQASG